MSRVWELNYFGGGAQHSCGFWSTVPSTKDLVDLGLSGLTERAAGIIIGSAGTTYGYRDYYIDIHEVHAAPDPNQEKWEEFQEYVEAVTYKPGWYIRTGIELGGPDGSRMWVQIGVTEEAEISFDPIAGKKVPWRGGKHYLSPHMCRQEVVGTLHHAFQRAELHEMNEWFRYEGRSIYNPHLDPDALVEVARYADNFNTRENAMTMEDPE